jgi:hypothetical protein
MRQSLVTDETADLLLDFLASSGDQWVRSDNLAEWSASHNLYGEGRFIPRLAQNLAGRGLAEVKRIPRGVMVRLTPDGLALASWRNHRARAKVEPLPDDACR